MKHAKVRYLLLTYLVGILLFTLFRLVNTWVFCSAANPAPDLEGLYWRALLMGWRFDTVVSCYILAFPIIAMLVGEWARIRARAYYRVIHCFIVVLYVVAFLVCAIDIPYFSYFFSRFNALALNYDDNFGVIVDMVLSEPSYLVYLFVFIAVAVGYCLLMHRLYKRFCEGFSQSSPLLLSLPVGLLMVACCIFGMRGRIQFVRPIQVGNAYFCNNAFLNQIGLNPVFTFVKSFSEMKKSKNQPVDFIDLTTAEQVFSSEMAVSDPMFPSPVIADLKGCNVVMVIMESMATYKTGLFNPAGSLTPCLDSLMAQSLLFDEAYSAGTHTYNGIYGLLYAHPAIMAQHPMKRAVMSRMCGIPHALRFEGYQTLYFLTHFSEFDNMGGFLRSNGFQRIISQEDYPAEDVVGTWGVHDHVMFDRAIQELSARQFSSFLRYHHDL